MLFLQSGVAFCLGYSLPRSFCQREIQFILSSLNAKLHRFLHCHFLTSDQTCSIPGVYLLILDLLFGCLIVRNIEKTAALIKLARKQDALFS